MWPLCRKSMGPPPVQFIVPPSQCAEEEATSCSSVPPRPTGQPRGIPTVNLFIWPFTWWEETGRQCSCVCEDNREPACSRSQKCRRWLVYSQLFVAVRSALMMLNNILHYSKWGCGSAQCRSCRKGSKTVFIWESKSRSVYLHQQVLQELFWSLSGNDPA